MKRYYKDLKGKESRISYKKEEEKQRLLEGVRAYRERNNNVFSQQRL